MVTFVFVIFQYKNIAIHVFTTPLKSEKNFLLVQQIKWLKTVVRKRLFNVNISNIKKHIKNYQKKTVLFIGGGVHGGSS